MRLKVMALTAALVSLVSCGVKTPVDFITDPSILRGHWQGYLHNYPEAGSTTRITLHLEATYLTNTEYAFEGTFQTEGEAPHAIHGIAHAAEHEVFIRPQIPAPIAAGFTATVPALGVQLCAMADRSTVSYSGAMSIGGLPHAPRSPCSGQYGLRLKRIPNPTMIIGW